MTVDDFMNYSLDVYYQTFTIYDVNKGEEVFTGTIDDCPDNYLSAEVCTFDNIDKYSPRLTLNVTLED